MMEDSVSSSVSFMPGFLGHVVQRPGDGLRLFSSAASARLGTVPVIGSIFRAGAPGDLRRDIFRL